MTHPPDSPSEPAAPLRSVAAVATRVGNALASLYLTNRIFYSLVAVACVAVAGFWHWALFYLAVVLLVLVLGALVVDIYLLYAAAGKLSVERRTPRVLSLSDSSQIRVLVRYAGQLPLRAVLTDELPFDLQVRDQAIPFAIGPDFDQEITYPVRPLTRGEYEFGDVNLFLTTRLGLAEHRLRTPATTVVPVYPSIIQMQQFALKATTTVASDGRRRLRRLTKSYEFDQIKEYVTGDDYRSINWKATGRTNQLMVNQYEDERSQRIYCCVDRGRTMLMPFNGLSLLDYAINATLALSNVIIKRQDRAGLITFADKIGTVLPADARPDHLRRIMEALYREEEKQQEADYDLLYYASRKLVGGRSLMILFTNFESTYALDRTLPALRRVARAHQLIVVLFENTEIADLLKERVEEVEDVYRQSTARDWLQQRQLMAARLRQNGVNVVLTRPEQLSGAVINKYLELKRRGVV